MTRGMAHTQGMYLQPFQWPHDHWFNAMKLSQGHRGVHQPTSPFDPRKSWEAFPNRPIKRSQSNLDETGLVCEEGRILRRSLVSRARATRGAHHG